MDVLLIHPPFLEGYSKARVDMPPLGVAYVASAIRQDGHRVSILDLNLQSRSYLDQAKDFHLVGISGDTPRHTEALKIARRVREQGVPVAMGGPHVTCTPEESLRSSPLDYVIRGEGEASFRMLVDDLSRGGNGAGIPGVSCRDNGEVVHNAAAQFMDINEIPLPSRDLLPMTSYRTTVNRCLGTTMVSSRGCPFNCSFCSASEQFGVRWRPREPEAIVEEMEFLHRRYGYGAILFMDDNFTLDPDRAIRICELIGKRDLDIYWWCPSRVNTVNEREDMVEALAEAGNKQIFLGVETPHEELLNGYGKKATSEDAENAVRRLQKHGISVFGGFLLGDPRETKEMMKQTISYAKRLGTKLAQFSLLTPYPGTRLYEEVKERILPRDWSYFDGLHSVVRNDHLTPRQMESMLTKAYLSYYLHPKRLYPDMFQFLFYLFKR